MPKKAALTIAPEKAANLLPNGTTIDENPPKDFSHLPAHVQALCHAVFDESVTVLKRFEAEFQRCKPEYRCSKRCRAQPCEIGTHKKGFEAMDWDPILSQKGLDKEDLVDLELLRDQVKETQVESRELCDIPENEAKWDNFYLERFFKKLQAQHKPRYHRCARGARSQLYYDSFGMERQQPWTIFNANRYDGKKPQPDLSLHFNLHYEHNENLTPNPRHEANPNVAPNFSRKTLLHLVKAGGLEPSPFSKFYDTRSLHSQWLLGFPWFIAEYKREEKRRFEEVVAQAANAARCALQMYSGLVMHKKTSESSNIQNDLRVPPIVTMTTIASKVQVWVAWSVVFRDPDDPGEDQSHMQCIWKGDVRLSKDIIKLQLILESLHAWATRDLRGKLSAGIDHWLCLYPPETSSSKKPTNPRAISDPTPFQTPRITRNGARQAADLVVQSQGRQGQRKSSRSDLFPNASTSKLDKSSRSLSESPDTPVLFRGRETSGSRLADPASPLASKGKKAAAAPRRVSKAEQLDKTYEPPEQYDVELDLDYESWASEVSSESGDELARSDDEIDTPPSSPPRSSLKQSRRRR